MSRTPLLRPPTRLEWGKLLTECFSKRAWESRSEAEIGSKKRIQQGKKSKINKSISHSNRAENPSLFMAFKRYVVVIEFQMVIAFNITLLVPHFSAGYWHSGQRGVATLALVAWIVFWPTALVSVRFFISLFLWDVLLRQLLPSLNFDQRLFDWRINMTSEFCFRIEKATAHCKWSVSRFYSRLRRNLFRIVINTKQADVIQAFLNPRLYASFLARYAAVAICAVTPLLQKGQQGFPS